MACKELQGIFLLTNISYFIKQCFSQIFYVYLHIYILHIYIYIFYIFIYIVVTMKQFSENKVLNIVNVEL